LQRDEQHLNAAAAPAIGNGGCCFVVAHRISANPRQSQYEKVRRAVSILRIARSGGEPAKPPRETGSFHDWIRSRVTAERYWFHRIELFPDLATPGWSDPKIDKLPYFGLPDDMSGMRVLDIGCAEGFFSFEAERRGAAEVVAIDSFPDSVRRFNLCRDALNSKATAYLSTVYDLNPRSYGTFDMVFFFGVLYHLRHPLLALEKILAVSCGTLLMQTFTYEDPAVADTPMAKFHPLGLTSTDPQGITRSDPTVFWAPNQRCVIGMLQSVGFKDVEIISHKADLAVRASVPVRARFQRPNQHTAPWS
jgi:tRNA (mo5U34)-methyltransferase